MEVDAPAVEEAAADPAPPASEKKAKKPAAAAAAAPRATPKAAAAKPGLYDADPVLVSHKRERKQADIFKPVVAAKSPEAKPAVGAVRGDVCFFLFRAITAPAHAPRLSRTRAGQGRQALRDPQR